MLLGHADAGWKRARIKPPYTLVARSMVRGFILRWKIDRLAIVLPGATQRQFRVGFAERDSVSEPGGMVDSRLAALTAAAHKEWSRKPRHLRRVWGRPWPVPLLTFLLLAEVLPFLPWLARHGLGGAPASDAYYALVILTALVFALQVRLSNAIALLLAGVQFIRTAFVFAPLIQSRGFGVEAFWLALYLSEPVGILMFLWLLYADRDGANDSHSVLKTD